MAIEYTKDLPEYKGLVVDQVSYGTDMGYGFLLLKFVGGVKLRAYENGQAGEIVIEHNNSTRIYPQDEG